MVINRLSAFIADVSVPDRFAYALVVAGFVLCTSAFVFAGGYQRACPGIESLLYETIGIYPGGFELTGIDLGSFELRWYDGCNGRFSSLVQITLGIGSLVAGATAIRR